MAFPVGGLCFQYGLLASGMLVTPSCSLLSDSAARELVHRSWLLFWSQKECVHMIKATIGKLDLGLMLDYTAVSTGQCLWPLHTAALTSDCSVSLGWILLEAVFVWLFSSVWQQCWPFLELTHWHQWVPLVTNTCMWLNEHKFQCMHLHVKVPFSISPGNIRACIKSKGITGSL